MMDWASIIAQCANANVRKSVTYALNKLFERDMILLVNGTGERTISHQIAQYLQICFPDYDVDVEYNRMGNAPKKLLFEERLELVYPDIIVHSRMSDTNILAIELKKDSNHEPTEKDRQKLRLYRTELGYKHALFLRLGTGTNAGTITECEWA